MSSTDMARRVGSDEAGETWRTDGEVYRPLKAELSSSCLPWEANKVLCVGEKCDRVYILRKRNKQIKEDWHLSSRGPEKMDN
jgi:hypothetical protein